MMNIWLIWATFIIGKKVNFIRRTNVKICDKQYTVTDVPGKLEIL